MFMTSLFSRDSSEPLASQAHYPSLDTVPCCGRDPAALENVCQGPSCRERLHQPRVKRKQEGNWMHYPTWALAQTGESFPPVPVNGSWLNEWQQDFMSSNGYQIQKTMLSTTKHSSRAGTDFWKTQVQLDLPETQGNSSLLLSLSHHPKLPPLLHARASQLKEDNKATDGFTNTFSMQREVRRLCHAGGRDWANILKYYFTQKNKTKEKHEKTKWMKVRWKEAHC